MRALNVRLAIVLAVLCVVAGCAGFQKWIDSWDPPACEPGDPNYDPHTGTCACKHPGIDCTEPTDPCSIPPACPNPGGFGAAKDAGSDGDAP